MLKRNNLSPHHKQMIKSAFPLQDCFKINHFWYYKITHSGNYSYIGTNEAWNEFCFDTPLLKSFTCLRHLECLPKGISLMKAGAKEEYKELLDLAWEKFGVNFNINITNETNDGVEAFGFATNFNDPYADERLLNKLSYLREFIRFFKEHNAKALHFVNENKVHLPTVFGQQFYEPTNALSIPFEREKLLRHMGFGAFFTLTPREKDILKFIAYGYPASYVAQQLCLSKKTVENYLATIKCKLACTSKIQLIQLSQQISATGFFDESNFL
ncbi:MAG: helix-turn-helix transcriptional regulator [Nitrosopumilus sp.]|nr:helix-turn-helix transcriptional regulator [Nitrosopumilus sp.]